VDFSLLDEKQKQNLASLMLDPLNSAQEVKDWIRTFLDLEIPNENTDEDSTSNPLDSIWYIYNTFKTNSGDKNPGAVLISSREGMKTISVTILELLLLVHFQLDIGHAAAIESQSAVALRYIEGFLLKIGPLLKAAGWEIPSQNKRMLRFKTPQGKQPYIMVVICSPKGMNSLHSNVLFLDELDLADKEALREGRNIVGYSKGIYGMTVYISSYKYSIGNVTDILEKAEEMNYKILKWNILDVTERCPEERHRSDEPKRDIYISKELPLKNLTEQEFLELSDIERQKYILFKDSYAGCLSCSLAPICKGNLAKKSAGATGGFFKPITTVIQKFKENDPETATSQLLCRKPGSEGLVYPRFSSNVDTGNIISVKKAYEFLIGPTGDKMVPESLLISEMIRAGIEFYCGVDWGMGGVHDTVILVIAKIPTGEWWLVETYAAPGMEFTDTLEIAKSFRDKYRPIKWFADNAVPIFLTSFNKNGMRCAEYKKDVLGGISAVRSKLLNSNGKRYFKVLATEGNKKSISAISKHRFKLDGQGMGTLDPADEPGIADICDALRYIGQNLWAVKGHYRPDVAFTDDPTKMEKHNNSNPTHSEQMRKEISKRVAGSSIQISSSTKKKGGFFFNS
jgi:hypothetical protein